MRYSYAQPFRFILNESYSYFLFFLSLSGTKVEISLLSSINQPAFTKSRCVTIVEDAITKQHPVNRHWYNLKKNQWVKEPTVFFMGIFWFNL
jgi:hypothetical protein